MSGANANANEENRKFSETGPESVRLTPGWEDRNLSSSELNFRGVESAVDKAALDMDPPPDRLNIVYLTFILHGIGTLMPWNMFITAKGYFVDYKLGANYTGIESAYADNFMPYLGFASQVPNVIFNWLNIFIQMGGSLSSRIIGGLLVEVVIFVTTVVLAMVDSSTWPGTFFWVTMTTVVILNSKFLFFYSFKISILIFFFLQFLQWPAEFIKILFTVWPLNCHSSTLVQSSSAPISAEHLHPSST